MSGKLNRSTMSNKSRPKTSAVTLNAADIEKARSADQLHQETEAKDVESGDETKSYESNESELSELLYTCSKTEELFDRSDIHNESTDSECDQIDDVQGMCTNSEADVKEGDVCVKHKQQGLSQLHLAAERDDTEAARSLLMSSANVDVLDTKQNTPLHIATLNGHVDVVNLLLSKNASVNSRNELGQTSLHLAAEIGHLAIAQLLLQGNADVHVTDHFMNTPIHVAAILGHCEVIQLLMKHSVLQICYGNRPLHLAAKCGHSDVVQLLLNYDENPDATNLDGDTPLHLASKNGHFEVVENLIYNGANVNTCNNAKTTPLHLACQNGHTSIVEILLDNHAIVDVTIQSEETPFYLASKYGHADTLDLLLSRGVCDFVDNLYKYETPLGLLVVVDKGHTKVASVILKYSCRISEELTRDGKTLPENTKRGVIPVELLKIDGRQVSAELVWTERNKPLEKKIDSELRALWVQEELWIDSKVVHIGTYQCRPMYSEMDIAREFCCFITRITEYFRPNALSDTIKYRMNLRKIAQYLINSRKFNVNHQDCWLKTILHDVIRQVCEHSSCDYLAKESNRICLQIQIVNDVIQLLLEKGADFNMKNSYGETPLMIASEKGCCETIQILFGWEQKSGMKLDIDARDRYGATALIKTIDKNHDSAVRLLLNHNASVNLYDNYGFTALHAAIYESNSNWFDLHFFCKGLRKRIFDDEEYPQIGHGINRTWKEEPVDRKKAIDLFEKTLEHSEVTTRIKEKMIKLLLANNETNVNAIDFGGNTPLDLAMKSSKRISSATLKALKNRGAICNSLEPEDEAPIEEARIDERGRNPLHRLVISRISDYASEDMRVVKTDQDRERYCLMFSGILLSPENFMESVTATDDKGRTPLHYAVMPPSYGSDNGVGDLVRLLLKLGSNLNAGDFHGKTPLHYAEINDQYQFLVECGADENIKDRYEATPKDLKQLRGSVTINEDKSRCLPVGKKAFYRYKEIPQLFNTDHVTELTTWKRVETIRIRSQSPRPQESSEEVIWKIWTTENEFIRFNRRLSKLRPSIHQFIERLADGMKENDWRFECQPNLVGSANEETKAVLSADFDFNFKLIQFSQLCEAFPHPLGPKGYFQLKRKPNEDTKSRSDFACFFDSHQCLLTTEVNSRFQVILKEVLGDHYFWQEDHLFELNLTYKGKSRSKFELPNSLYKTLRLKMIHPTEDGEGGFLFVDISIDVVACVHVEGWWSEYPLPVGISPSVKTDGCTMVFDRPRFDPSKPSSTHFLFSETFARISFAPLESRIIRESSPLIKAAYIVCKMILHAQSGTTYQLKACLLFCMEALNSRCGSERRNEEEITTKQLAFWVERIMFCFMQFSRHRFFPCYFMPSFKQRVARIEDTCLIKEGVSLIFSKVYEIYLDLCPDDTAIDIPVVQSEGGFATVYLDITEGSLIVNHDPLWEQFDWEEFIRKLSSHIP